MGVQINAAQRLLAAKLTNRTVESAIKKKFGLDVKLRKGNGYYYFDDPDDAEMRVIKWPETSVYVNSLNQLTLDQWLHDFEHLMQQGDKDLQHRLNEERYGKRK
jgi:hypothetical protein